MRFPEWAKQGPKMPTKGKYAAGWPSGLVVHYTAGADNPIGTMQSGVKQNYGYWITDKAGNLYCGHSADQWTNHAGKSAWGKIKNGVNSKFLGLENCNSGRVKGKPGAWKQDWSGGKIIPDKDTRTILKNTDNINAGTYEKFTDAQIKQIKAVAFWLKFHSPDGVFSFNNVVGHDEVSGPKGIGFWRKTDPGGAMNGTMSAFRADLIAEYPAWAKAYDAKIKSSTIPLKPIS